MGNVTEYKASDARAAKDWLGLAKSREFDKPTAKELRELEGIAAETDKAYKAQLARDAKVGAGRGLVNPNSEGLKKGGKVSSASKRADGIAQRGKTRGKMY